MRGDLSSINNFYDCDLPTFTDLLLYPLNKREREIERESEGRGEIAGPHNFFFVSLEENEKPGGGEEGEERWWKVVWCAQGAVAVVGPDNIRK